MSPKEASEFVGKLLDYNDPLIKKYVGKSVKRYLRASGSAIHYSYNADGELYKFDKSNRVTNP